VRLRPCSRRSTPEEGGETVFPQGEKKTSGPGWSECARKGMAVKAIKGDAILFYSLLPNGKIDQSSEHGSCPTLKAGPSDTAAAPPTLGCVMPLWFWFGVLSRVYLSPAHPVRSQPLRLLPPSAPPRRGFV
jgi:hypothetical protein